MTPERPLAFYATSRHTASRSARGGPRVGHASRPSCDRRGSRWRGS